MGIMPFSQYHIPIQLAEGSMIKSYSVIMAAPAREIPHALPILPERVETEK
jgi:hypothetical protein